MLIPNPQNFPGYEAAHRWAERGPLGKSLALSKASSDSCGGIKSPQQVPALSPTRKSLSKPQAPNKGPCSRRALYVSVAPFTSFCFPIEALSDQRARRISRGPSGQLSGGENRGI